MEQEHGQILIVDDNRLNRLTLARGVEQQGHTAELAEDGRRALELMRGQSFDVVILDIIMPEMDGYEVLTEIKSDSALRDIPVIVVSAVDDVESIVRCIELGAEDYLTKPFNPVILKARLDTLLEKKRHRDLERAYLQQELMLRENEKLATLGRLSAGMAHEINNPASAAMSGARQTGTSITRLQQACFALFAARLSTERIQHLEILNSLALRSAGAPDNLDALARGDREQQYEQLLDHLGVPDGWNYISELANLDVDIDELAAILAVYSPAQIPAVISWLSETITLYSLNEDIQHALERVTSIVGALKSYSYMDQAPVQRVDVHEGLNNTIVMLNHKIDDGVVINREFSVDLPRIQAYGSELNQVWTNLINNAIDALNGAGSITIRTCQAGDWLVVEIEDTGVGIPEDVQPRIFDPFFTTKPPGQGVGLGLSITHTIIVQKHNGAITAHSHPGQTRFEVKLPIDAA